MSTVEAARDKVFGLISEFLADPISGEGAIVRAQASLADSVLRDLHSVLSDSRISYRDGILIQLGFGIAEPTLDLTQRPKGARSMAQQLGLLPVPWTRS